MLQCIAEPGFDAGEGVSEGCAFRPVGEEHGDCWIGYLSSEEGFDGIQFRGVTEQVGTVPLVEVMNDVVEGREQSNVV
ncbi:hypothetical protein GZL_02357 [Streptomyces sp. 769]|nr:hypothetical protein GZL_02357 [Streptomyces sp. 769]